MSHDLLYDKRMAETYTAQIEYILNKATGEKRGLNPNEHSEVSELTRARNKIAEANGWGSVERRNMPGLGDYYPDVDDGKGGTMTHPLNPDQTRSGNGSKLDLALAGWLKNGAGVPVSDELVEAGRAYGTSIRSTGFDIPFERTRPRLGSEWFTRHDRAAAEQRSLSAVSGVAGGYTIQDGFIARLERAMLAQSGMLRSAEVMVTSTGADLPWPTSDDSSNEGALIGENTAVSEQDITFGAIVFRAHKLTSKLVRVPTELLEDTALNLSGEVGQILGERIGRIGNRLWTVGTGAAQPKGLINAATVGVTAASATAIAADELIDLVHSVDESYRSGASFMMNDSTLASLRKLKNGDGDYLFQQSLVTGQPDRLLGYPIVINQHMATIAASAKVIAFGQLSKYKIRLVGSTRLRQLTERFAEYDQVGFLGFLRIDGNLLDAGTHPVKVLAMHA